MKVPLSWIWMIPCALALSGCMPVNSRPPPLIYALHASLPHVVRTAAQAPVISIREPDLPAGFDSERIALYLNGGRNLDYYAGAAWPDSLGNTMHKAALQSANSTPGIMGEAEDSGVPASYTLFITVNDFEPVYAAGPDQPPHLRVAMNFRLISMNRQILLNENFSAEKTASGNTRTIVVSELENILKNIFNKAFTKISSRLRSKKARKNPLAAKMELHAASKRTPREEKTDGPPSAGKEIADENACDSIDGSAPGGISGVCGG